VPFSASSAKPRRRVAPVVASTTGQGHLLDAAAQASAENRAHASSASTRGSPAPVVHSTKEVQPNARVRGCAPSGNLTEVRPLCRCQVASAAQCAGKWRCSLYACVCVGRKYGTDTAVTHSCSLRSRRAGANSERVQ
jgi:hypothetical protein